MHYNSDHSNEILVLAYDTMRMHCNYANANQLNEINIETKIDTTAIHFKCKSTKRNVIRKTVIFEQHRAMLRLLASNDLY